MLIHAEIIAIPGYALRTGILGVYTVVHRGSKQAMNNSRVITISIISLYSTISIICMFSYSLDHSACESAYWYIDEYSMCHSSDAGMALFRLQE